MRIIRTFEPFLDLKRRDSGKWRETADILSPDPDAELRMIENLPPGVTVGHQIGCYVWWVVP